MKNTQLKYIPRVRVESTRFQIIFQSTEKRMNKWINCLENNHCKLYLYIIRNAILFVSLFIHCLKYYLSQTTCPVPLGMDRNRRGETYSWEGCDKFPNREPWAENRREASYPRWFVTLAAGDARALFHFDGKPLYGVSVARRKVARSRATRVTSAW